MKLQQALKLEVLQHQINLTVKLGDSTFTNIVYWCCLLVLFTGVVY